MAAKIGRGHVLARPTGNRSIEALGRRRPQSVDARGQRVRPDQADEPVRVARGFGGRIELYPDRVRIVRDGLVNYLLVLMGGQLGQVDTVIAMEKISTVDITSPIVWNDYVTIAFPGSPPQTGRPIVDATAENALFCNFLDNRGIHDLVRLLRLRMAGKRIDDRPAEHQGRS